jgi:hypothetical protein
LHNVFKLRVVNVFGCANHDLSEHTEKARYAVFGRIKTMNRQLKSHPDLPAKKPAQVSIHSYQRARKALVPQQLGMSFDASDVCTHDRAIRIGVRVSD